MRIPVLFSPQYSDKTPNFSCPPPENLYTYRITPRKPKVHPTISLLNSMHRARGSRLPNPGSRSKEKEKKEKDGTPIPKSTKACLPITMRKKEEEAKRGRGPNLAKHLLGLDINSRITTPRKHTSHKIITSAI